MTTKPRSPRKPRKTADTPKPPPSDANLGGEIPLIDEPIRPAPTTETISVMAQLPGPIRPPAVPASRLDVLADHAIDGMVTVRVLVSHDGVYQGNTVKMPVSERTAGLIEIGFLKVIEPETR